MSFRVEQATGHRRPPWGSAIQSSGIAGVEGAVKGGRSPAKRTLDGVRDANKLKDLVLVAAFRGQRPSPSGGKDFTALGVGPGWGRPKGSAEASASLGALPHETTQTHYFSPLARSVASASQKFAETSTGVDFRVFLSNSTSTS